MNQNFSDNSNLQNSTPHNVGNKSANIGNGVGRTSMIGSKNQPNSTSRNSQTTKNKEFGNRSSAFAGRTQAAMGSAARSSKTSGKNKNVGAKPSSTLGRRKVLSVSQLLLRVQKQRQLNQKKRQKPIKPIIPPKSLIIILKDKPEKAIYNRRIIDYKHCGLLQRYIGLGGKILPRRQTKLTAKQQRYIAKTIKTARIMGLLPFVTKERGFFR